MFQLNTDLAFAIGITSAISAYELLRFLAKRRAQKDPMQKKDAVLKPLRAPRPHVLFLDIDGVLHPGYSETLAYLPNLEEVLRRNPAIDVVISSTWRETSSFGYLLSLFSEDIRHRIVGVTPVMEGDAVREREIMEFVKRHRIRRWLAVDDSAELFSEGWPHLLLTDRISGLSGESIELLEKRLADLV